jgi:predicted phage-related endonuclease
MADGTFFEDFAKTVYERETKNVLSVATSFVSDWFVATPDARVFDVTLRKHGGLECKIVGDATFMGLMEEGIPIGHELQTQSQMMASGWDWVDYIVVNLKTRAYFILRVSRNNVLIKRIYERLHQPLDLPVLKDVGVKQFDDNLLREFMGENQLQDEDLIIKDLPF